MGWGTEQRRELERGVTWTKWARVPVDMSDTLEAATAIRKTKQRFFTALDTGDARHPAADAAALADARDQHAAGTRLEVVHKRGSGTHVHPHLPQPSHGGSV